MAYLLNFFGSNPLAERILRVQSGDSGELNRFIQDYEPFIVKTVSRITHRYIETENNEEFIVGLEAFHEAVMRYDKNRGEFLKFATMVISSRINDLLRKNARCRSEVSLQQLEEDSEFARDIAVDAGNIADNMEIKSEFALFQDKLGFFDISLGELVESCPRHRDTRSLALAAARWIAGHETVKNDLYRKKRLPYPIIMEELKLSRKFLSKNRQFVIAAVLILDSELELIKDYIIRPEGDEANVI